MRSENGKVLPVTEIYGSNLAGRTNADALVAGGNSELQDDSWVDSFYEKLSNLFESTGLSLLFNFRDASLDLYMFYKEVTERGGYQQVTKEGRWGEVTSNLIFKSTVSMSPTQVQKLYGNLLYQFEQTYHYRTPAKLASASGHPSGIGDSSSCSMGKRKHCDNSPLSTVHSDPEAGATKKRMCNEDSNESNQMSTGRKSSEAAEQKLILQRSPNTDNYDTVTDTYVPLRSRTAYQIFLKKECDRLKGILGERSQSHNLRDMAIDAWRSLSQKERQPYIEESRKDRERFKQEMTDYKEQQNMLDFKTQKKPCNSKPNVRDYNLPWQADGDYHVTLQSSPENVFVPDESAVKSAFRLIKDAKPDDVIFQINWDDYGGSLDITS